MQNQTREFKETTQFLRRTCSVGRLHAPLLEPQQCWADVMEQRFSGAWVGRQADRQPSKPYGTAPETTEMGMVMTLHR